MKEKIWKLLELLNEYDSWWDYDDYYWPYQYWQDTDAYQYGKYYLVSRDYWFIKWLVENDKIDLLQLDNRIALSMSVEFNKVERVLMALSISDTPIEDLVSYLR